MKVITLRSKDTICLTDVDCLNIEVPAANITNNSHIMAVKGTRDRSPVSQL